MQRYIIFFYSPNFFKAIFINKRKNMANSKNLVPFIKKWEGHYCDVKGDRGGCTNAGVTIGTFKSIYGQDKTCLDLKKLTDNQWSFIFKKLYWDKCYGDYLINQSVANMLVDWYWTSGKWAIIKFQKCLNVTQDGDFGKNTLNSANKANPLVLFNALKTERKNFFCSIVKNHPSQRKFLKGWLNRANSLTYGSAQYGFIKKNGLKLFFNKIKPELKFYYIYTYAFLKEFYDVTKKLLLA